MSTELTPEQQERVDEEIHINLCKMLRTMKEHFGDEAYQVIVKARGEGISKYMSKKAEEIGDNSIEAMLTFIQGSLPIQGFEFTNEETESGILVKHIKCPVYEMAKRIGFTEEMFYLCCEGDQFIPKGFNPNIGFKRTKTLMQGHDYCDSLYYYKDKGKQS